MKISNEPQMINGKLIHLLGISDLPSDILFSIFEKAESFKNKAEPTLKGKTVINAFFENSTRTLCSFELAAKRLGATVLNFNAPVSSLHKKESVLDTIRTLAAMEADAIVIRHPKIGVPYEAVEALGNKVSIINAGDGEHAHPTQAILDGFTLTQHKKDFSDLIIAIVGDIKHSRVARSQIEMYKTLGVKEIRLVGPENLSTDEYNYLGVVIYHDMESGIKDADVVNPLRIQEERINDTLRDALLFTTEDYYKTFGLTQERLSFAKPDAIVMHPGPLNREVEISSDVADGPQSVILEQVRNGVLTRMAILDLLLS